MARIWESNESRDGDEELAVTEQRDRDRPAVTPESEPAEENPEGAEPRDALEAQGEDVASSPARRGQHTPERS